MTVISRIAYSQNQIKRSYPAVYYLNIFLIMLVAVGFLGYIFISNQTVSNKFNANILKNQYNEAIVALELESVSINSGFSLESLTAFAVGRGMIEVNDSVSIFDESGLAVNNSLIQQ